MGKTRNAIKGGLGDLRGKVKSVFGKRTPQDSTKDYNVSMDVAMDVDVDVDDQEDFYHPGDAATLTASGVEQNKHCTVLPSTVALSSRSETSPCSPSPRD